MNFGRFETRERLSGWDMRLGGTMYFFQDQHTLERRGPVKTEELMVRCCFFFFFFFFFCMEIVVMKVS